MTCKEKLENYLIFVSAVGVIAKTNKEKSLSSLGEDIGLLFQLADDFLDKNQKSY